MNINRDLCTGCGRCVPVCPHELFVIEHKKALLVEGSCMVCGHCRAACPEKAISLHLSDSLGLCTIQEKTDLRCDVKPSELVQLMRIRRSCRNYADQPVAPGVLQDLVKIGTTAPSGTNCQPWKFIILEERNAVLHLGELTADYFKRLNRQAENPFYRFIARLFLDDTLGKYYRKYHSSVSQALTRWNEKGEDLLFHGAPSAILVAAEKNSSCPVEDAMLATQNIVLAAESMNIGSCLIGFVVEAAKRDKKMRKVLGINDDIILCSVIALGYKKEKYVRPAGRKPVDAVIKSFQERNSCYAE